MLLSYPLAFALLRGCGARHLQGSRVPARDRLSPILTDWRIRVPAALAMLWWYASWVWNTATVGRPDFLRPSDIGGDVSNYLAAGQRLLAGHPLYALTAGDRPVPFWAPPAFTVPIISPPQMAVPWAILSVLPGGSSMTLWWAACVGVTVLVVTLTALRAPWPLMILLWPLGLGLSVLTLSGNLNALILGISVLLARVVAERPNSRLAIVAGALAGAVSVCKLGPVLLVLWLLATGARRPFVAAVVTAIAVTLVPLVLGGVSVYREFLAIAGDTSQSGATSLSVQGFLVSRHFNHTLAKDAGFAVPVVAAVLVVVLRRFPRIGFVVAIAGMVWATPVVRFDTVALLIAVLAPWWSVPATASMPGWTRIARRLPGLASGVPIAAAVAVVVIAAALATSLPQDTVSSVRIVNTSSDPIVAQFARAKPTMAFPVAAGSSGIAWGAQPGRFQGTLTVFDATTCRLLATPTVPPAGGTITVGADDTVSIAADPGPAGPGDLPYVTTCGPTD